jgi:hypothetical protein
VEITDLPSKQRGIALLLFLVAAIVATAYFLLSHIDTTDARWSRAAKSQQALAEAREALIAFAVSIPLDPSKAARPGELPCPDLNNDGQAEPACSKPADRLGRLPWKTLGLPDLRDTDNERLWYALSDSFKNNPKKVPLNSDTRGTIAIKDATGTLIQDRANGSASIAVIIAPGKTIRRQGASTEQARGCSRAGVDDPSCLANEVCTSPAPAQTDKCNPVNYLDVAMGEDNADFTDDDPVNGFIQGEVRDLNDQVVVNDRFVAIRYDDLMPLVEKRVAEEGLACLRAYAAKNGGRYPWAAKLDPGSTVNYQDDDGARFGRLPDQTLDATHASSDSMDVNWTSSECNISPVAKAWWTANKWKELVFYGVADAFKPGKGKLPTCGACLSVDPFSSTVQAVIIVAGQKLPGQVRADKGKIEDYLEGKNTGAGSDIYEQRRRSDTFNDTMVFLPRS